MMLGLRLRSGVDLAAFGRRFGTSFVTLLEPAIRSLEPAGLVEMAAGKLRIPDRHVFVANDLLCRLLAA
jgi:coproporphyrinogen III oxidase-like Fe-S oxidoreductase